MESLPNSNTQTEDLNQGITSISVKGFKSLYDECTLEIKPLTILAGANSSGKSSIMQPILLMKQTLESHYDPGALLINGNHVKFTSSEQLLSNISGKQEVDELEIKIEIDKRVDLKNILGKKLTGGFEIRKVYYNNNYRKEQVIYSYDISKEQFLEINKNSGLEYISNYFGDQDRMQLNFLSKRCFISLKIEILTPEIFPDNVWSNNHNITDFFAKTRQIIHLPGLRGTPERSYPITAIGDTFQGTFDNYVASVIHEWQYNKDPRINQVGEYLTNLGLTSQVAANRTNDVQVEIQVGKLTNNIDKNNLINIADVGLGVSQVLPVIVALLVAKPGQLVYIEQPEIHLHPRAQANLAPILVDAANRGVKVVVETHSDLLLTRIQTLVAEGLISQDKVNLNWFQLREDGITQMYSTQLDETGSYGDWPVDFSEITLAEDDRYLTAAESRLWKDN